MSKVKKKKLNKLVLQLKKTLNAPCSETIIAMMKIDGLTLLVHLQYSTVIE